MNQIKLTTTLTKDTAMQRVNIRGPEQGYAYLPPHTPEDAIINIVLLTGHKIETRGEYGKEKQITIINPGEIIQRPVKHFRGHKVVLLPKRYKTEEVLLIPEPTTK